MSPQHCRLSLPRAVSENPGLPQRQNGPQQCLRVPGVTRRRVGDMAQKLDAIEIGKFKSWYYIYIYIDPCICSCKFLSLYDNGEKIGVTSNDILPKVVLKSSNKSKGQSMAAAMWVFHGLSVSILVYLMKTIPTMTGNHHSIRRSRYLAHTNNHGSTSPAIGLFEDPQCAITVSLLTKS